MVRVRIGLKSAEEDRRGIQMNKEEIVRQIKEKRQTTALLSLYVSQVAKVFLESPKKTWTVIDLATCVLLTRCTYVYLKYVHE